MKKNKILIVIPTYNEKENIKCLIDNIFDIVSDVNILIVDDSSPDGTGELIKKLLCNKKYFNKLFLMSRTVRGLGGAYIEGLSYGIERKYKVLITMDADFSHHPKYLTEMIRLIKKYDCVIGSRYVMGGQIQKWCITRKFLSYLGSLFSRMLLKCDIRDMTGGFNCYRSSILKKIQLNSFLSKEYFFQIEIKYRHILLNKKIYEMPILFTDRTLGTSKMNFFVFLDAVFNVIKLFLKRNKII